MIGKTISHYRITEKIGEGGMGQVFLAEDTKLKRKVAIKFLPSHLIKDKESRERFEREAQAAAALNHPNIVTIHEIGEFEDSATADKQIFISMEYVDGQTLQAKIKDEIRQEGGSAYRRRLKIKEVIEYTIQIAKGLNEAHQNGIIHRDIKPANIIITNKGEAKILDFGLAKLKGAGKLTKETSTLGTVNYMSPEQAKGKEVDHRTDIWSLGVIFYEMLTGQLPFKGEYDQAVVYSILNEEPPSILDLQKEIPTELGQIVEKALVKNPEKRYQNVEDIIKDLKTLYKEIESGLQKKLSSKNSINSIAVLPFVNMSGEPENEYFSDGLTEELINSLTQLKDLRVVARTSSFAFKSKEIDIRKIGNQLNVQKILEGSVRKAGNRIRITTQLINIEDGYHIWSERYDRDLEDVFAIQDEIAQKIANKLKTKFRLDQGHHIDGTSPDVDAYELYLKGRYYFNKFSPEWIQKAVESFSEAVVIDPKYALAYAGLAEAYVFLSTPLGTVASTVAMPKAKIAAEKALELQPNLSEAYVSLGAIATFYDWDIEMTHNYFQRAITLNPKNPNARLWYEMALSVLDQDYNEAFVQLKMALDLDPLNQLIQLRLGYVYCYQYNFDTAINYFKKIINYEPNNATGYHGLLDAYGMKEDYALAIKEGEKAVELGKYAPPFVGALGLYCARFGKRKRAKELLSLLLERSKTEHVSPFWIGIIYLGFNDLDQMFEWFDKAYQQRDGNLLYLFAPPFDSYRNEARYIALRQKMGFEK